MTNTLAEKLLSPKEVAERLNVAVRTVRDLVADHDLPAYRVGGQLRFSPEALDSWLERRGTG